MTSYDSGTQIFNNDTNVLNKFGQINSVCVFNLNLKKI